MFILLLKASRKAINFARIDPIGGLNMSCPSTILNTDYLRCNITFTNGTNLKASIDYGDGQSPDVFLVGSNRFYILLTLIK